MQESIGIQDKWDAGQEGDMKVGIQDRCNVLVDW